MDATSTFSPLAMVPPSLLTSLSTFSISSFLLCALSLVLMYRSASALYETLFSPLASIPGPLFAAVSDFWLITHVVRMQQCRTVQELFEKYGPIVRVGPKKVVFCDLASMRSVYCVNKFEKSSYYKSVQTNNNDHAMTTLPNAEHAMRKRAYSPFYMPSNIARFQTEIRDFTLQLVDILDRVAAKTSVDCLDLSRHLMVDIISATLFGCRPGSMDKWALNAHDPLTTAVNDFPKRGIIRSSVSAWAWNLVCRIPNRRWQQICDSDKIMAEFVGGQLCDMQAKIQSGQITKDVDIEKMPLLQRMLHYRVFSTGAGMSNQDVISEGMGHLVAGVDSSSTTLSYLFWELSRRSDIMKKLQDELDEAMPDRRVIPDISSLHKLPYLTAFLKEGYRIYGAVPSLLERVVPEACPSKVDDTFDLLGFELPPGTIVATQAWSMHRNADIFPSPETFLPERWLRADCSPQEDERLSRMEQYVIPFGVGSRVCGGQNLAQTVLRIVVATVISNFDIIARAAETNERSMEICDAFILFPASKECKLTFVPRK